MRSTTASVGDLEPRSYAESVGWEVPERRATASCAACDGVLCQAAGDAGGFQERAPVHNMNISLRI
jgi:hypothetical protein